jgi:hypothetical protein
MLRTLGDRTGPPYWKLRLMRTTGEVVRKGGSQGQSGREGSVVELLSFGFDASFELAQDPETCEQLIEQTLGGFDRYKG